MSEQNRIQINRSDGICKDLLSPVLQKSLVAHLASSSLDLPPPHHDDESLVINISRSDCVNNDVIKVLSKKEILPSPSSLRIVHMSDTFNLLIAGKRNFLPAGDILVHSGNFTKCGSEENFNQFDEWLASVKDLYRYRIVVMGSSDILEFGEDWDLFRSFLPNATHILSNNEATILGLRFYGRSVQQGSISSKKGSPRFEDIPEGIHILVTHAAAFEGLDSRHGEHCGNRELTEIIRRVQPLVHLHGQVHESRGTIEAFGTSLLTVNSAMADQSRNVLFATAHVLACTKVGTRYEFALGSLE